MFSVGPLGHPPGFSCPRTSLVVFYTVQNMSSPSHSYVWIIVNICVGGVSKKAPQQASRLKNAALMSLQCKTADVSWWLSLFFGSPCLCTSLFSRWSLRRLSHLLFPLRRSTEWLRNRRAIKGFQLQEMSSFAPARLTPELRRLSVWRSVPAYTPARIYVHVCDWWSAGPAPQQACL